LSAGSETCAGRAAIGRSPHPLELRAVDVRYGSRRALRQVELCVRSGEVVVLVGPNGSGKTTLLHVAAGLRRPDAGGALVVGAKAGSMAARRSVALVPDEPAGLDELTVSELVRLMGALAAASSLPGAEAVAHFDLASVCDVRLGALSRGLRRRAALAAALAAAPVLLLVDEASATLDEAAVGALVASLRRHAARGGAAVVATHDLAFARRAADRAVLLSEGAVVGTVPVSCLPALELLLGGGRPSRVGEVDAGVGVAAR
jgi:ABC-2 type transport system ATP-binding protein